MPNSNLSIIPNDTNHAGYPEMQPLPLLHPSTVFSPSQTAARHTFIPFYHPPSRSFLIHLGMQWDSLAFGYTYSSAVAFYP